MFFSFVIAAVEVTANNSQINPTEAIIITEDKEQLRFYCLERPGAQRCILICHGKGDSGKRLLQRFASIFPNDTLYAFDFRGHGKSTGKTSSGINEYKDVTAVLTYVNTNNTLKKPLFAIGISMGGASLMKAIALGSHADGMLIDSAYADLHEIAQRIANKIPVVSWFPTSVQNKLIVSCTGGDTASVNITTYGKKITTPTMILHSEADELIPYEHGKRIRDAITGSQLIKVTNVPHACICAYCPAIYKDPVEKFFAKIEQERI